MILWEALVGGTGSADIGARRDQDQVGEVERGGRGVVAHASDRQCSWNDQCSPGSSTLDPRLEGLVAMFADYEVLPPWAHMLGTISGELSPMGTPTSPINSTSFRT